MLWQYPADIASRDLYYGPGGKEHAPHTTFTFIKEDMSGTNPKFEVRDEDGTKWKVKLGVEARPETVASRLVWAVGYNTNEDYFLPTLRVEGMPRLRRGQNLVGPDGTMQNVRLKRYLKGETKIGDWKWRDNPFVKEREFNGLRVVMALINNWDLKDVNNSIYEEKEADDTGAKLRYEVTDLGASFGTTGRSWTHARSKGNLKSYRNSKFIQEGGSGICGLQRAFTAIVYFCRYSQRVHGSDGYAVDWKAHSALRCPMDGKPAGTTLPLTDPRRFSGCRLYA